MPKDSRVSVKVEQSLKQRLGDVADASGVGEAALVRAALLAVCEHFEEERQITVPFSVIPTRELDRLKRVDLKR